MNSNEEYLDSLLKSVAEKEASIQESGIVSDLSELDDFSLPEEFSLPNELISEEQDIFASFNEFASFDLFTSNEPTVTTQVKKKTKKKGLDDQVTLFDFLAV